MAVVHVTRQAHLAFCRVDQVMMVVLANREKIGDEDLQEFIDFVVTDFRRHGVVDAFFTYSPSASLSAGQRKMLTDATEQLGTRRFRVNAFVTDSILMRGAATAMSWFFSDVKIKAFPLAEVPQALTWLKTENCPFDRAEAQRAFEQMLDRLRRAADVRITGSSARK